MDYPQQAKYNSFLIESMIEDAKLQRYINECIILTEGSEDRIERVQLLNEAISESMKNVFTKFTTFIRNIFDKFMANVNSLIKKDESFLKKYKDTIITKKVDPYTINNMPDYNKGIANIQKTTVIRFDMTSMKDLSEVELQKKMIPEYKEGSFKDFCNRYFLDGDTEPKDVRSDTLNMTNLYNFCMDRDKVLNIVKKDQSEMIAAAKSAESAITQAASKTKTEMFELSKAYSVVYEAVISEADDDKPSGPTIKDDAPANTNNAPKANLKLNVDKTEPEKKDKLSDTIKNKDDKEGKSDEQQAKENSNEELDKIQAVAKMYIDAASAIFAAKLTAINKIYSEYMKIIKHHVRKATGSKNKIEKLSQQERDTIREYLNDYNKAEADKNEANMKKATKNIIDFYKSKLDMDINSSDVAKLAAKNKPKNESADILEEVFWKKRTEEPVQYQEPVTKPIVNVSSTERKTAITKAINVFKTEMLKYKEFKKCVKINSNKQEIDDFVNGKEDSCSIAYIDPYKFYDNPREQMYEDGMEELSIICKNIYDKIQSSISSKFNIDDYGDWDDLNPTIEIK